MPLLVSGNGKSVILISAINDQYVKQAKRQMYFKLYELFERENRGLMTFFLA